MQFPFREPIKFSWSLKKEGWIDSKMGEESLEWGNEEYRETLVAIIELPTTRSPDPELGSPGLTLNFSMLNPAPQNRGSQKSRDVRLMLGAGAEWLPYAKLVAMGEAVTAYRQATA